MGDGGDGIDRSGIHGDGGVVRLMVVEVRTMGVVVRIMGMVGMMTISDARIIGPKS